MSTETILIAFGLFYAIGMLFTVGIFMAINIKSKEHDLPPLKWYEAFAGIMAWPIIVGAMLATHYLHE